MEGTPSLQTRRRVAFGCALTCRPDVLLLDDPRDPRTRAFLTGDMIY